MTLFEKNPTDKRSPIKKTPLRTAGQSLEEEIHRIQSEDFFPYLSMTIVMVVIVLMEWYRWFREIPPSPFMFSIGGLLVIAYSIFKISQTMKKVKILKQARDGEKAVGEFLDRFREKGYRVFHDIVAGDFNIDHLLIGKTGVYTIETKTISKYTRGSQTIKYDGASIQIYGQEPGEKPIIQAKAQAGWIREILKDLTGQTIRVQPVVVYPGWFVEKQPPGAEVWVLNPKALDGFIKNMDAKIDESHIPAIATHLSRFVRNS